MGFESITKLLEPYCGQYWPDRNNNDEIPEKFGCALADTRWIGITMPREYGGSGLGITEAAK